MTIRLLITLILFSNLVYAKDIIFKQDPSQSLSGNSPENSSYKTNADAISSSISNDFLITKSTKFIGAVLGQYNPIFWDSILTDPIKRKSTLKFIL